MNVSGVRIPIGGWQVEFDWVIHRLKGRAFAKTLLELAWNGSTYQLWRERNEVICNGSAPCADKVSHYVLYSVRIDMAMLLEGKESVLGPSI